MSRWLSITLSVCLFSVLAASQDTVTIKAPDEIDTHELSAQHSLPIAEPGHDEFRLGVILQIVVGTDGSVISATPLEGNAIYFDQAVQSALRWRFSPFTRDGHPVRATFTAGVRIVPPERRPNDSLPMPEIRDWNSLRMTLSRTGCFGSCPQYDLVVHGSGAVEYTGEMYVKYCGEWRGTIALSSVHELVGEFRAADYFTLYPEYTWGATDLPTFTTSISFDNVHKKVTDYGGQEVGMPESVHHLENTIDRLAGPGQWVTRKKVKPGIDTNCDSLAPASPEMPLPDSIPPKPEQ
jgi:hypothetical protein